MKYKKLILFLLFILCINIVISTNCGDVILKNGINEKVNDYCTINSGTSYVLHKVITCKGDIVAKIRNKYSDNFYLKDFIIQSNNIWISQCNDGMEVILETDKNTNNEFDITLEYYLTDAIKTNNTEKDELHNSIYRKTLKYNNIKSVYNDTKKIKIPYNIKDLGKGIYILFSIFILAIIIVIYGIYYILKNVLTDNTTQINERKNYDKIINDDVDNILNNIKKD